MTTNENEAKDRRVVIVAGAQGVSGSAVLKQYAALPGTTVYGLSRRPSESSGNIQHISVDLLSPGDVKAKLGQLKEITHFFFGAYVEKPTATEKTEVNVRLLWNLLDVLEKNAPALRHITLYQGGKAYGSDLGPYKTIKRTCFAVVRKAASGTLRFCDQAGRSAAFRWEIL
jgi:nucleoside-diphosphate-sugar epimerase